MNNEIMQKLRRIWPKGALDKSGESNFCEMMRRVDPRLQWIRCECHSIKKKKTHTQQLQVIPSINSTVKWRRWGKVWEVVFVFQAAITNYFKLDDLKQQPIILSQFWRPEV